MLDMSLMRAVWVDPVARTARAQAGCLLGDVDRETQLHGLATVLGFVSNTGLSPSKSMGKQCAPSRSRSRQPHADLVEVPEQILEIGVHAVGPGPLEFLATVASRQ